MRVVAMRSSRVELVSIATDVDVWETWTWSIAWMFVDLRPPASAGRSMMAGEPMGFSFRKSVKMGPLRLTASKSGVSVSAGVKGARLTSGPRGTYVTIGAHGLRYRQRIDQPMPSRDPRPSAPVTTRSAEPTYDPTDPAAIRTADVSELVEASNAEVLAELNERAHLPAYAPWVFGLTVMLFLITGGSLPALAWTIAVIGVVGGSFVARGDRINRTTPLYYELTDTPKRTFTTLSSLVRTMGGAQRVWRVQAQQANHDWKRNAGAGQLISRAAVTVGRASPPFIRTNVEIQGITAGATHLLFFPDHLLVFQQGRYGAVDYRTLQASAHLTTFIEHGSVPGDAQVVSHTWQYVNKNGGPDKRFNNNRQLPVMRYGEVHLTSASGLNMVLHVSNAGAAEAFARGLMQLQTERAFDFPEETVGPPGSVTAATGARTAGTTEAERGGTTARKQSNGR